MHITDELVLRDDVLIIPVADLADDVRKSIDCEDQDFAISRPASRAPSVVVDARAADLLKNFRTPRKVVEAVILFSRIQGLDPEQVLESSYPLIRRLLDNRFLTPAESDGAEMEAAFPRGEQVGGAEVVRLVQALDDSEIYQVRLPSGQPAALKILCNKNLDQAAWRTAQQSLERETRALRSLDGSVAPTLIAAGETAGRPYLLLEWISGIDAYSAAAEWRGASGPASRKALVGICAAIASAYAYIHEAGVLHGDVHPRNVMINRRGKARILDFGLARLDADSTQGQEETRGGIPFFFEPEYARALLLGTPPPRVTPAGEQYSLAALLYYVAAGVHTRDFSLERERMLTQLAEEVPGPFRERGLAPWPELEEILARALAIAPEGRFESVRGFARALSDLHRSAHAPRASAAGPHKALSNVLTRTLERSGLEGEWLKSGLAPPPTASVNYGAAGIAAAILHLSCVRDDAKLLALADVWSMKAVGLCGQDDGFYNPEIELTRDSVGESSLYHSPAGVFVTRALISSAMGDVMSEAEAVEGFLAASALQAAGLDLTVGRSSTLLGCTFLLDAVGRNPYLDSTRLQEFGDQTFDDLQGKFAALSPIADGDVIHLGIAHGWAGYLYALLQWHRATGRDLGPGAGQRLEQLAELAEPAGRGLRWPWQLRAQDGQIPYMPGWCNGSAGFVFLWTLAHRLLNRPTFLELAEGAAWDAWDAPDAAASLCCGLVGRSYALLNLYRHTAERKWLDRARVLARRAAEHGHWQDTHVHSLYKGELALAALAADLERPEEAVQPFFEIRVA